MELPRPYHVATFVGDGENDALVQISEYLSSVDRARPVPAVPLAELVVDSSEIRLRLLTRLPGSPYGSRAAAQIWIDLRREVTTGKLQLGSEERP